MQVKFKLKNAKTSFGESLYVVGNDSSIGAWNPDHAYKMETDASNYPAWFSH